MVDVSDWELPERELVLTRKYTKRNERVHIVSWNSVTGSVDRSSWIVEAAQGDISFSLFNCSALLVDF